MGMSSDGILVFGIDLGENPKFLFDEENEEHMDIDGFIDKISDINEYNYEKSKEAKAKLGIDMTLYCSYECPMYILAVPGTETNVSRGSVEVIDPDKMKISQEQLDKLKAFFDTYVVGPDVEYDEYDYKPTFDPKWLLASMYG